MKSTSLTSPLFVTLGSGASSTAQFQRPVQWDGRDWVPDEARLAKCLADPRNTSDTAVHQYTVDSVLQTDVSSTLRTNGARSRSALSFAQVAHSH